MSITRRKAAPYSKSFMQCDPELPLAFLYCGPNAWSAKDQLNSRSIILPPHEPSENYDWRVLKNQIVICYPLGDTELTYRERLAYELLCAGARDAYMILPKNWVVSEYTTDWIEAHEHYKR